MNLEVRRAPAATPEPSVRLYQLLRTAGHWEVHWMVSEGHRQFRVFRSHGADDASQWAALLRFLRSEGRQIVATVPYGPRLDLQLVTESDGWPRNAALLAAG